MATTTTIFTVELNVDSDENTLPRAARRLIFNADFLKAAKLCTGDTVILSSVNGDTVRFLLLLGPDII